MMMMMMMMRSGTIILSSRCWLVARGVVYDATSILPLHPGGRASILNRSGGEVDCDTDLQFHTKRGQKRRGIA
jgi:hypothetical protein